MFNLHFENDSLYDISREELLSVLNWKEIEITQEDVDLLGNDLGEGEIIAILSKYCKIERNIEEEVDE